MDEILELAYTLPYQRILEIEDLTLKQLVLKCFENELNSIFASNHHLKEMFDPDKSIEHNMFEFEQLEDEITSEIIFPGNKVLYYRILKEQKARKKVTCDISGAIISPGNLYNTYKAFLYNKTTHTSYVSKSIRFEVHTDFNIPTTLHEFEYLYSRINASYELDLEREYNIWANIGGMSLKRLKRKK